ncbi:MAG: glycosyltransferase [Pseudomonadota bacterium]
MTTISDTSLAEAAGDRMRLAILVPWITKGRGGTENVGQMMANAMTQRGHEVEVFTFDDDNLPSKWELRPEIGLTRLAESDAKDGDLQMMVEIARFAPDLIVGLHMNSTFRRYVRSAHRLGLPIVLSEHIDPRFPARLKTFDPALRETVMSGATRIHFLVEAFRETVPAGLRDRVRIIPNTTPPASAQAVPGESSGTRTVLTVARLVKRKNVGRLIGAFARIADEAPNWVVRVVGDGPEMDHLKEMSKKVGVSEQVEFVGHVEDVSPHYAASHLFVLPSLFEGFPMSSLEAMAHGLPILGYGICNGINEQIEHGANGLLSSGGVSAGSLSDDMLRLMADDAARAKMGRASFDRYNKLFSNEVIFAAWETLFREAIAAGGRRERQDRITSLEAKLEEMIWGDPDAIHIN